MTDQYEQAGVRDQDDALSAVARHLGPTFSFVHGAEVLTDFGHYAAVLKVRDDLALALCTDGVGSKTVIASALDRYDTIAFDCMAMNVNDLICVGARPLAVVDYLGVHTLDERRTDQILQGLGAAAKEAGVAVPGGELAQLPDVIGSDGRSEGDPTAFDLVATAIGTLRPEELVLGDAIAPGDVVIGIRSSGLHSNGFTLARRVLRDAGLDLHDEVPGLGCTLGDELLRPTEIYVRALLGAWNEGIRPTGMAHVTGDGLLNLGRLNPGVGYRLDGLPQPQPIFDLIAEAGDVAPSEMYRVFNMGVGFVVVARPEDEKAAVDAIAARGHAAQRIGTVTDEAGIVRIESAGLAGTLEEGFAPV
ncbi:MAG: phosphoribosylformylglycinamidine cyclo-ligase [Actinomycetota bacterium]|nr:phosphoribosylformylglycinamidine cyclo-ligase [Actinomycetota bacterium]